MDTWLTTAIPSFCDGFVPTPSLICHVHNTFFVVLWLIPFAFLGVEVYFGLFDHVYYPSSRAVVHAQPRRNRRSIGVMPACIRILGTFGIRIKLAHLKRQLALDLHLPGSSNVEHSMFQPIVHVVAAGAFWDIIRHACISRRGKPESGTADRLLLAWQTLAPAHHEALRLLLLH